MGDWANMLMAASGLIGSVLAWVIADSRSKSRLGFIEEKVSGIAGELEEHAENNRKKIGDLEIQMARSQQDSGEMHRILARLDDQKASKEVVDGIRSDITSLRLDMDKRFDKLERLLENGQK